MDTQSQNFKVRLGLFIAVGTALFFLATFIIGEQKNLFNPVFKLTTTFHNVSGLQVGNNIRFSGIIVGSVNNIRIFNDSTVKVEMAIKKSVNEFIKSDSKVTIGLEGLIGDRLLIITQGSSDSPIAVEGQQLESNEPVETEDIMAGVKVTATNAETISKQLVEFMYKINSKKGTLGRLIQDSSVVLNLDQTVINLKNISKELDENLNSGTKKFLSSLQVTADNAENISKQMAEIMSKINSDNSTLTKFIQDSSILQNLEQTMVNLKNGSRGFDENMNAARESFFLKRYFDRKQKEALKAKNDSIKGISKD
jgi:phospholipid/cholesterol/gamma-HCH transport system substrate-binding protein